MKRKVRPNVISGGAAINLGNNLYYMRGKTHKQGGIDIGSNPKTGIEVDKKSISLNAPINKIGEYKMLIKLTSKVKCELAVVVTASEVVKEAIEEEPATEETAE